jgi:hypothetical protein
MERTITILVKDVQRMMIDGANERIVKRTRS